jgi:hypothetical protein
MNRSNDPSPGKLLMKGEEKIIMPPAQKPNPTGLIIKNEIDACSSFSSA